MSASRTNTRPTVIVAADFAALGLVSGAAMAARQNVLANHRRTFTECLENHRGTVLKNFQPRAVAEFSEASDALDCILDAKKAIERQNAVLPSKDRVHFRVGVHMGDLAADDLIMSSEVVRRANLLTNFADVGGTMVSLAVYQQAPKFHGLLTARELGSAAGDAVLSRVFVMAGLSPTWNAVPVDRPDGDEIRPLPEIPNSVPVFGAEDDDDDGTMVSVEPQQPAVGDPGSEMPGLGEDDTTLTEEAEIEGITIGTPPRGDAPAGSGQIALADQLIAEADAHAGRGEPYYPPEKYGRAMAVLSSVPGQQDRLLRMNEACQSIEAPFALTGDAIVELDDGPRLLRIGSELHVGRRGNNRLGDLHVGCALVSRMDVQARIAFEDGAYRVTDLGSTNGTFLGNLLVESDHSAALEDGADLRFGGGLQTPKPGPCMLRYERVGDAVPALVLSLRSVAAGPADADLAANWPTMEADCRYRWILTPGPLLIVGNSDCSLRLPNAPAEILAQISYDEGYILQTASDHPVLVNGARVTRPVRLANNVRVEVGSATFGFHTNAAYFAEHPPG